MRSVSQIYSEALIARNNYLQLTELNSGVTRSKMSILNLFTYITAVCIHTYEAVLDAYQTQIANVLTNRINGTPQWYATIARLFQYDSAQSRNDEMVFDEDTLKIKYATINKSRRIVSMSAWEDAGDGHSIILKVAKTNADQREIGNGTPYANLTAPELTAFREFIHQVKFVGSEIRSESKPGDILTIIADVNNPIYYDDRYVTKNQEIEIIKDSMITFIKNFTFNGILYYQDVIDALQATPNITELSNDIRVFIQSWDTNANEYGPMHQVTNHVRLASGYMKLLDENGASTINLTNIKLLEASTIQ